MYEKFKLVVFSSYLFIKNPNIATSMIVNLIHQRAFWLV